MNHRLPNGLHFLDEGTGPVIVCLHSMAGSARMWDGLTAAALASGWRVVRFDARQHGESAGCGGFTIERSAQDALELLDHLQIDRCHVVSISMGGQTAMHMAVAQPQRFGALVLANTSAGANPGGAKRIAAVLSRIAGIGYQAFADEYVASRMAKGREAPGFAAYVADALVSGPDGYEATLRSIVAQDLVAVLPRIAHPALLIAADRDPSTTPEMMRRLGEGLPDAQYLELRDAGHFSCLDQPEAFQQAALRFLERHPL
jgi:3-oxoadipate enol-lactonase